MKVVILVCTFAASALLVSGAPALPDVFVPDAAYYNGPYLRAKRSYGPAYASPCAAASLPLAPVGGYGGYPVAAHASYGGGGGGVGGYGGSAHAYGAPSYGYGGPHYRADDAETEILNFSDMENGMSEHHPMARFGYGAPVAAHASGLAGLGYGGQLAPAAASGPAFGVFPNANVGGCNVPLLLSCSPSIVPGRLVKSGYGSGYGAGAAAYGSGSGAAVAAPNAYRGADDQPAHEHDEHVEEMSSHSLEHTDDTKHTDSHQ